VSVSIGTAIAIAVLAIIVFATLLYAFYKAAKHLNLMRGAPPPAMRISDFGKDKRE